MRQSYMTYGKIKKFTDGDTFEFLIDLGFGIFNIVDIRLRNVWAPELTGSKEERKTLGYMITDMIAKKYADQIFYVQTFKTPFEDEGETSFNRWIGDIFSLDGELLNPIIQKDIDDFMGVTTLRIQ